MVVVVSLLERFLICFCEMKDSGDNQNIRRPIHKTIIIVRQSIEIRQGVMAANGKIL